MLLCGRGWISFRSESIRFLRARQAGENTSVQSSRSCSLCLMTKEKEVHHLHSQLSHFDTSILGGQSVTIFPDSILELG